MMMHTGIISFCDRVRYNIKSPETKDVVLGDLEARYGIRVLQRHWHRLEPSTVQQVQRFPHWACLRSNGNPYYMYLTTFDDINIIYFVDKKVQPGYERPRIILGRGRFADDLFKGTVLDGEMVRRTDQPGWVFLVNDVVSYRGEFLQNMPLPRRLSKAYEMFRTAYTPDPFQDVCSFLVKRYVLPTRAAVEGLVELSKTLPYTSRGVYLWPHSSRAKPKLINFDDSLVKSVHRKVKDCPDFRQKDQTPMPPPEPVSSLPLPPPELVETVLPEGDKVLWLRKTENPDIYDVYTTQQCQEKLGTACIQTLVMSKRMRGVFKDLTVATSVPYVCSYNSSFDKWVPVRRADGAPTS
jgi:hypothetical protein